MLLKCSGCIVLFEELSKTTLLHCVSLCHMHYFGSVCTNFACEITDTCFLGLSLLLHASNLCYKSYLFILLDRVL